MRGVYAARHPLTTRFACATTPIAPADDLYARLEIPVDAGPEVIEVAWRSLLRQHHPDVAGDAGLERSKRINVAHDWLSDRSCAPATTMRAGCAGPCATRPAAMSATYGAERRPRPQPGHPAPSTRPGRDAGALPRSGRRAHTRRDRPSRMRRPDTDRLRRDDRPVPAARPARRAGLDGDGRGRATRPAAAALPGVRDAVEGYATELVLGEFLDELLSEPFRDRARERLTRGWERPSGSRATARTATRSAP